MEHSLEKTRMVNQQFYTLSSHYSWKGKINKVLSMQLFRNYINPVPFLNNINNKSPKIYMLAQWKMIQIEVSSFIVQIYTHYVNLAVMKWCA